MLAKFLVIFFEGNSDQIKLELFEPKFGRVNVFAFKETFVFNCMNKSWQVVRVLLSKILNVYRRD